MTTTVKLWTRLGLGVALAGGGLAACGSPEPTPNEAEISGPEAPAAPIVTTGIGGEGEGAGGEGEGESGEGEGGVATARAATDPIVYQAALAITEAHIIAARDAHALGEVSAAAEMFAHPVSEVLFDMQPVFEQRGVADFGNLLTDTSAAVLAGESSEQISARSDAIIMALRAAAEKSPDNGTSEAGIAAGVAADQIERAADMYRVALDSDAYEPYLDGYGFYKAAEAVLLANSAAIAAENDTAATALNAALAELSKAYPSAVRPDTLDADLSALTVAASNAVLAVSN